MGEWLRLSNFFWVGWHQGGRLQHASTNKVANILSVFVEVDELFLASYNGNCES